MKNNHLITKEPLSPLPDPILETARTQFGITYLYPYQRLVIQNIMDASTALNTPDHLRDTRNRQIVTLPTGYGKSLCFMLPGALLPGITLIIFPLLALMADQLRRIEEAGLKGVMLKGGQEKEEREGIWKELEFGKVQFILTNPETLKGEAVAAKLMALPILHGVIDEAHTVNEWGKSFRPAYLELGKTLQELSVPIITAFTATASPEVMDGIRTILFNGEDVHTVRGNPDRENLTYRIVPTICPEYDLGRFLFPTLAEGHHNPETLPRPAIVFCASRTSAEITARQLREQSGEKEIFFYHAGLSREEKKAVEEWFFTSGNGILCATCAYGMGVDKSNIRTVIHREPPATIEAFLQESGRAGRDRKPAQSLLLLPWPPAPNNAEKSRILPPREAAFNQFIRKNTRCRREGFMELLGSPSGYCAGCDVCAGGVQETPRGWPTIKELFRRHPRFYDKRQAAFLLAGRGSRLIRDDNLFMDPCFAKLSEWTPDQIASTLDFLIYQGIIIRMKRGLLKGKLKLHHRFQRP